MEMNENVIFFLFFFYSTKDDILIEILEQLVRIREDNDASYKKDRFSVFVNFILEKEHSHKYVDPNMKKILRPKIRKRG